MRRASVRGSTTRPGSEAPLARVGGSQTTHRRAKSASREAPSHTSRAMYTSTLCAVTVNGATSEAAVAAAEMSMPAQQQRIMHLHLIQSEADLSTRVGTLATAHELRCALHLRPRRHTSRASRKEGTHLLPAARRAANTGAMLAGTSGWRLDSLNTSHAVQETSPDRSSCRCGSLDALAGARELRVILCSHRRRIVPELPSLFAMPLRKEPFERRVRLLIAAAL